MLLINNIRYDIKKKSQISVEIIEQDIIKSITNLNDWNKSYQKNLSYKDNFVQELKSQRCDGRDRPNNINK